MTEGRLKTTLGICGWLILAALVILPLPAKADTVTLDFTAEIDGQSLLLIQGNTLQWQNVSFCAPGQHTNSCGDSNLPTTITTTDNGVTVMSAYQWYPTWPSGNSGSVDSSIFAGLDPGLPATALTVALTVEEARESLTIDQQPTAANGYQLVLDFDDVNEGSSAYYEGQLSFTTQAPVPEPASWLLLATCVIAVFWAFHARAR